MEQLEIRSYTKKEMADILGITIDAHFSRNVKTTLNNWGYKYIYGKNISIDYKPSTATEIFQEFTIRELGLDIRIDTYAFACLLNEFINNNDFKAMPWAKRIEVLNNKYGIEVDERTLKRWGKKLIEKNILSKAPETSAYWFTQVIDGDKTQTKVDKTDANWKEYWKRFYELAKSGEETPKQIVNDEFGGNYFGSKALELNACNDYMSIKELNNMVKDVIK